jgi:hypothetical protein
MQIKNFEDLEIWKAARCLTHEIYTCSRSPRFSRDYALRDQMQRAAVSIMSNIAEGFERGGNQESFSSSTLPRVHVEKSDLSFMWRSINILSTRRSWIIC